jgi:hypothetical protein
MEETNNKLKVMVGLSVILEGFILAAYSGDNSGMNQERELIRLVLKSHKNNSERLITWKGEANDRSLKGLEADLTLQSEQRVFYALDNNQNAVKWIMDIHIHELYNENKEELLLQPKDCITKSLMNKEGCYRYMPGATNQKGDMEYILAIYSKERSPWRGNTNFHPMQFLIEPPGMNNIPESLNNMYQDWEVCKASGQTFERAGDIVTMKASLQKGDAFFKWMFDLSKGGNLISYESISKPRGLNNLSTLTYVKINDVWVPKSYTEDCKNNRGHTRREILFVNHEVNEKIDPNEFTLSSLDIPIGTRVMDTIAGIQYQYKKDIQVDREPDRLKATD